MTKERLSYVIEHCFRGRRRQDRPLFYAEIARWLGVTPITLRRWLRGERPVPRQAEIIFTILGGWPQVRAEAVDKLIEAQDRRIKALGGEKQH